MLQYSIADLSQITGVKPFTLRAWEKRYGLFEPDTSGTKGKLYGESDLRKVLQISAMVRRGFRISEICDYSQEQLNEKLGTIFAPAFIQGKINQLMKKAQTFDQKAFDANLQHEIIDSGIDSAIRNVIIPFMSDAEQKWISDSNFLCVRQFAFDLIRRRLIVSGDLQVSDKGDKVLIFTPLDDCAELQLLITDYAVKKSGMVSVYCGENVSVKQAKKIFDQAACKKALMVGKIYDSIYDFAANIEQFDKIFDGADKIVFHKKADEFVDQFQDVNFVCDVDDLTDYLNEP